MREDRSGPALAALTDCAPDGLERLVAELGERPYRAKQLLTRAWRSAPAPFALMTELPARLREALHARLVPRALVDAAGFLSSDGQTTKRILRTSDGHEIESVWMTVRSVKGRVRRTTCVSTQIGCAFGCSFCASGKGGLVRSLRAAEIAEQVVAPDGSRPGNVVLMGMGEPLSNYDQVVRAIRIMNATWGPGIGARRITVSTLGLVEGIRRLAEEGLELELAISLHGPTDEVRRRLCPRAAAGVGALVRAARAYYERTGRVVTFEYALVGGVNDAPRHALELARRLRGLPTKVNLIPLNHVDGADLRPPKPASVRAFLDCLVRNGVIGTVRRERGAELDAACGQLRWRRMSGGEDTAASRDPGGR